MLCEDKGFQRISTSVGRVYQQTETPLEAAVVIQTASLT